MQPSHIIIYSQLSDCDYLAVHLVVQFRQESDVCARRFVPMGPHGVERMIQQSPTHPLLHFLSDDILTSPSNDLRGKREIDGGI
jgi:hypothetical protein